MNIITLQNVEVLSELINNNYYKIAIDNKFHRSLASVHYAKLSKFLNYDNCPIFCLEVNSKGVSWGAAGNEPACGNYENLCLIQMEVPDEFCTRQNFDTWDDYMNFQRKHHISLRDTFKITSGFNNVQVLIPYIKKEWITKYSKHPYVVEAFTKHHIMVGDGSITKELEYYSEIAKGWLIQENKTYDNLISYT